ncbi:MAG: preprotein translocase subunit SecG [Elusimicrobiota bacterium]
MHNFLLIIHMAACLLLILLVLLQAGRGAGFAIFGGGGDTLFASPGGSSALKKATVVLATTFAVTSLMLTLISSRPGLQSVTGKVLKIPVPAGQQTAPAQPAKAEQAPDSGADVPAPAPGK